MASNNSLLVGGAPLACDGAHPSDFRARMTRVRDLLVKESASVTCNHFFWIKAAHPALWTRHPSRDGALPNSRQLIQLTGGGDGTSLAGQTRDRPSRPAAYKPLKPVTAPRLAGG